MKAILSLLLTGAMAFMLTACAENNVTNKPENTSASSASEETAADPAVSEQDADQTAAEQAADQNDESTRASSYSETRNDSAADTPGPEAAAPEESNPQTQATAGSRSDAPEVPTAPTKITAVRSTAVQTTTASQTNPPQTTTRPVTERPATATRETTAVTVPGTDDSRAEQVAALVNEERRKAGVGSLTFDAELSSNAAVRAREIVQKFEHTRPDGSKFSTAITIPWRTVGENIAAGQRSPQEVMNSWMNSTGHRQNILQSSFAKIGVAVLERSGRLYWVQLFAG